MKNYNLNYKFAENNIAYEARVTGKIFAIANEEISFCRVAEKIEQMLKFIRNLFKGKKQQCNIHDVSVLVAVEKNTCKTCRFSKGGRYGLCWVGTYYAEQGKIRLCVEGELWEATEH